MGLLVCLQLLESLFLWEIPGFSIFPSARSRRVSEQHQKNPEPMSQYYIANRLSASTVDLCCQKNWPWLPWVRELIMGILDVSRTCRHFLFVEEEPLYLNHLNFYSEVQITYRLFTQKHCGLPRQLDVFCIFLTE